MSEFERFAEYYTAALFEQQGINSQIVTVPDIQTGEQLKREVADAVGDRYFWFGSRLQFSGSVFEDEQRRLFMLLHSGFVHPKVERAWRAILSPFEPVKPTPELIARARVDSDLAAAKEVTEVLRRRLDETQSWDATERRAWRSIERGFFTLLQRRRIQELPKPAEVEVEPEAVLEEPDDWETIQEGREYDFPYEGWEGYEDREPFV